MDRPGMISQSVLVTGAGQGIGKAIALAFAQPGNLITLAGRTESHLEQSAAAIRAAGAEARIMTMDVADEGQVRDAFQRYRQSAQQLDIVVNNAGISGGEPVSGSDIERWRRIIDVNLIGPYLVSREAIGLMRDGGRIINLSSVLGRFGVPGYSAYCASKHGVIGFTRALALELAPRAITVNAISPGWVDTDMTTQGMEGAARALGITYAEFRERALGAVPIGRIIQPTEVAGLVTFLASPAAAAITGQTYNICGGQTMD